MNPFKKKVVCDLYNSLLFDKPAQHNSCHFFVVKRSKSYNAVVSRQNTQIRLLLFLLFDVNSFLFCFLRDKFWCFYHFLWAFWHKKCVLFMEIYIPMKTFFLTKEEEKNNISTAYMRSYFPKFSLVLSANMY